MTMTDLFQEMPTIPWGEIGYITFKRTYARRIKEDDHNSKTEEFHQVIARELESAEKQLKVGFTEQEKKRYFELRMKLKFSTAGRFMWQLGTKTVDKLGLPSLQNCAFVTVNEPIRPFTWTFEMLMLGSGVGYNIQKQNVYQLPKLKGKVKIERKDTPSADFIVPDTREGWVKLLGKLLKAHFYSGEGFSYSTQLIRSKGAPIKGFGGTASGPEELCWGIAEISRILNSRSNKKLRPIDCLDVMNIIGYIVVSGNVRRSAQIAIGDYDDLEYLKAKRWDLGVIPNWRAMSNNSIVAPENIDDLPNEFWDTYNQGEPYGLINIELSRLVGRTGETQYPDSEVEGFNPCITGDTLVAVADGRNAVAIKDLVNTTYPVYTIENGKVVIGKSIKTWKTRENAEIWKLTLDDGSELKATPDHLIMLRNGEYKKLKDLVTGESLMPFNSYISNNRYRQIASNTGRDRRQYRMIAEHNKLIIDAKTTAIHHANFDSFCDSVDNLVSMSHDDHKKLHAQKMLGKNNPIHRLTKEERLEKYKDVYDNVGSKNPMYGKKQSKEAKLKISKASKKLWSEKRDYIVSSIREGMTDEVKNKISNAAKLRYNHKVTSIEFLGFEDVYDMTVEDTHNFGVITSTKDNRYLESSGIFIHNCAEQSLANHETCCLGEVYLPNIESYDELLEVLTYSYRMNKHSLALHCSLKETEDIVHKNMRMGIGMTGILQATEEQRSWLKDAYVWLRQYDKEYSEKHGFPISIKLTTVKPSGTLSLLAGVTPGVHPNPAGPYYIRRIRMSSSSPLIEVCKKHGYHVEHQRKFDGSEDKATVVVSSPCKLPETTPVAADYSWKDQMDMIRKMQAEWSDNSVSCTIYYKKEDLEDIKQYLKDHFRHEIKTVSFLLYYGHGFDQAPYETITKEQYEEMVSGVTPITSVQIKEEEFDIEDCATGACPVK